MANGNMTGTNRHDHILPNHADALLSYTNRLIDLLSDDGDADPRSEHSAAPRASQYHDSARRA